jgi:hypothetical protein
MQNQNSAFKLVFILSLSMLICIVFGVAAIALSGYSMGIDHVKTHVYVYLFILVMTLGVTILSGIAYRKHTEHKGDF